MKALLLAGLLAAMLGIAQSADQPPRRSGFADMSPATQALQRDDDQNPAWLWVSDGQRRFDSDCKTCHSAQSLRGTAARYPAFDAILGKPVTLGARINLCRTRHMQVAAWPEESDELLGLQAWVGLQSRGLPIQPDADARLRPFMAEGQRLFTRRMGQLDFSCAQCHDQHAGGRLAAAVIPQAHPTGYPIYRLEWQGLGSLQRRLRNCMTGVRAEPFSYGSDAYTALELFLMQRAVGLPIETPAVRP